MTPEKIIRKLTILKQAFNPISMNSITIDYAIKSVEFDRNTVRCKDCRYGRIVNPINYEGAEYRMCLISRIKVTDEDYCSQGDKHERSKHSNT